MPAPQRGCVCPTVRAGSGSGAARSRESQGVAQPPRLGQAAGMRLGIDFGTTRTVVAAVDDGRHPIAAFDHDREFRDYVPGIAALRGGELLVGGEAVRARPGATHAIRSIKRAATELAPDEPVPGLPGITALELVTAFLSELRRAIVEDSNLEVDGPLEVMAAVPASAASRQRWQGP